MKNDCHIDIVIDDEGNITATQDNPDGKENVEATAFIKSVGGKVKSRITKPSERHKVARVQKVNT